MATKQSQIKAVNKYNRKTYETISFRAPKSLCFNKLLDVAAQKAGKSKAQYIYDAIMKQLSYDNITISALVGLPGTNENNSEDNELD